MKNIGLRSPYARVGIFFSLIFLFAAAVFTRSEPEPAKVRTQEFVAVYQESELADLMADAHDAELAEAREWLREEARSYTEPCFEVHIDNSVEGYDTKYRTDLFGDRFITDQSELLTFMAEGLTTSFLDKTWKMDKDCFSGSFIVSFDVAEDGTLGKNMLVHHIRGGSNNAGFAVMEVLWDMERAGYQWHDGSQGAGEVRIPVSFKLI